MELPHLFPTTKDSTHKMDRFLGLIVTSGSVQSLLLKIEQGTVELEHHSKLKRYTDAASAVSRTDEVLQELGPDSEQVSSVLFAVPYTWAKAGELIEEKKPLLKKITDELSLEPLGFIVTSEAMVEKQLAKDPRYSGVLVIVGVEHVVLSLVERGAVTSTVPVGRSGDLVGDLAEGLARFANPAVENAGYLPPQLVLASSDENDEVLKEAQQHLLAINWTEHPEFLQTPTISILPQHEYLQLLAVEAGVAIAASKGLVVADSTDREMASSHSSDATPEVERVRPQVAAADLGFSEHQPTSFGIPIPTEKLLHKPEHSTTHETHAAHVKHEEKPTEKSAAKTEKKSSTTSLFHAKHTKKFILAGIVGGILTVAALGLFATSLFATARFSLLLEKKQVSKQVSIKLDSNATSSDAEKLLLAATTLTKTVTGENTILTTGIKIVGEKAKGSVTLYNKSTADKEFKTGTAFKAGTLVFTLDSDVIVASASVKEQGIEFGKAEVSITAKEIGTESNISKETKFVIESFAATTYEAVSIKDFTGGSSREVRVVAAADQIEVVAELKQKLIAEAIKALEDDAAEGVYVLPNATVAKEKADFDAKVDTEANEVTAKLEMTVSLLSYSIGDLQPLAAAVLKSEIPEGYELSPEKPQILSAPEESKAASGSASVVTLSANLSSVAVPKLNLDDAKESILGQSVQTAKSQLQSLKGVKSVEMTLSPSFTRSVPKNESRVEVVLTKETE